MFRNSKNVKMKKRLRWRVATVEAAFTKRRSVDFVKTYLGCVAWLRNCATTQHHFEEETESTKFESALITPRTS
jgi:hypothetical protein